MATNVKNILLEVVGRADDAQRSLLELAQSVRELPDHKTVEVEAQTREARKNIREMLVSLKTIDRSKATAEVNVAITKATLALEAFDEQLDDIEGRRVRAHIEVEVERAQIARALAQAQELLEATTARHQTVTVKLDMQIADAEANIARIRSEIASLPKERTVEIDAKAENLDAELAKAEAKLDAFIATRRVTELRFDAQTAKAEANIARLAAAEAALPDKHEIDIKVNQSIIGDLGRANAMIAETTGRLGKLADQGQRFGSEMADATFRASLGFLSFGGAIGPVFAVIAALTVAIGTSLVAALFAVAASFAAAAAGAAAFGAAIIAALGPIIGLAIAVGARIAKVVEALKAQDSAALQTGQKAVQGSQAATAAADRQAASLENLHDAQDRLRLATVQAWREMQDAAEAYSDAVRGIANAELGLDEARLSIREAEAALQDYTNTLDGAAKLSEDFKKFTDISFDFDTGALANALKGVSFGGDDAENAELRLERLILNVRAARQAEKNAVDAVSDAERNRSRTLATHNAFVRDGIAASQGYQAALRGVRDAQRQVNQASQAQEPAMLAAQAKAITLVGDLTKKERELLAAIKRVRAELRGAFRAATDAVFGAMIRALLRVPKLVNPLRGAFARLGRDIAAALDIFSEELIRPEWINAIRRFIEAGGRIARVFTRELLLPFLRIVRDIALAALPHLENGLRRAGRAVQRLSASAGPKQLSDVIGTLVGHLESWLRLAYELGRVFVALIRGASGEGQSLVGDLTAKLHDLGTELNSVAGQRSIRDFFRRMIPEAKEFLKTIGLLVLAMVRFANNAAPAVTKLFNVLNGLFNLIHQMGFDQVQFFATSLFSSGISAAEQAKRALDRLRQAEKELQDTQVRSEQAMRDLTRARRDAKRELSDLASAASGAKLTRRRAELDVRDARQRLAALKAQGGTSDDIERATLDLADARLRLRDATRDERRAVEDNTDAQAKGVRGTDTYRSALDRLKTALADQATATRKVVEAQREAANPPEPNLSIWDRLSGAASDAASAVSGAFASAWQNVRSGVSGAFTNVRATIGRLLGGIPGLVISHGPELFRAAVQWTNNIAGGIHDRAVAIRGVVGSLITGAIEHVRSFFAAAFDAGRGLGHRIAEGIAAGFAGIKNLGREIINGLIDLLNDGIGLINRATPGALKIKGHTIIPGIPDIDPIPHLAGGGVTTGETLAVVGDNPGGREAVLPFSRRVMRQLAQAITAQMSSFAFTPALAGAGGSGGRSRAAATAIPAGGRPVFPDAKFIIQAPAGSYPDSRTAMTNFERLVDTVGGDPNV